MKNIHVFAAKLPNFYELETKMTEVEGLLFSPLTDNQWSKLGLDPKQQMTSLENGYRIDFIYANKDLPKAQIIEEVQLLIEGLDYDPSKDEIGELTESVTSDFCARVIPKKVKFSAYYHPRKETLIFDCKEDLSKRALSLLLKMLGSIETKTLHCSGISNSLSTNMLNCLQDPNENNITNFAGFDAGDLLVMQNKEKDVVRFKGDYPLDNVQELLESGYEIKQINLSKDGVEFTLTESFKIKSIKTSFDISDQGFLDEEQADNYHQSLELELLVNHCEELRNFFDKSED